MIPVHVAVGKSIRIAALNIKADFFDFNDEVSKIITELAEFRNKGLLK